MCGIFVWADILHGIDPDRFEILTNLLHHRGPDDAGFYFSQDRQIGLGFRRLSIIDLSPAGHQPMSNKDGSIWVVFNGEVYNYIEIRSELETRGHLFRSHTDTEVVLHAYEEWGVACVSKLNGMFAFAVWDAHTEKIVAFRDRLGIKPLYYHINSHQLIIASELKPIINSPGFNKDINYSALFDYLGRGYISSPQTIFQTVKSLPPGCYLVWSKKSGESSLVKYWDVNNYLLTDTDKNGYSDRDWIDELDCVLQSAVKYQLVSDVTLGIFLSGGIDSSIIAAIARKVSNEDVKTFTVGFDETKYSEANFAEKIARYLGAKHSLLTARVSDAQELICQLPEYYDEPFADSSQIPTYLVSKLTRQQVTVALSGDGGDELFCGYETYQKMEQWQQLWKLPQTIRNLLGNFAGILPNERLKLAANGIALPNPFAFASYFTGYWRPREIINLVPSLDSNMPPPDHYSGVDLLRSLYPKITTMEGLMLIDLQRYLPNDILTKVDRASMAVSLETRVPILDHRVVELALKMPFKLKRRDGLSKFALRQVLYRYVPRELVDRPKHGFGVPLDSWLRTDLRGLIDKYLATNLIIKQKLFNPDVVSHQVKRFMNNEAGHSRIWTLLMFQMWAEKYLDLG